MECAFHPVARGAAGLLLLLFLCCPKQSFSLNVTASGSGVVVEFSDNTTSTSIVTAIAGQPGVSSNGLDVQGIVTVQGNFPSGRISPPYSQELIVSSGGQLQFSGLVIDETPLASVPEVEPLNVTKLRKDLLNPPVAAPKFMQLGWVSVKSGGKLMLSNVEVVTTCASLVQYHRYICSGAWTTAMESDASTIRIHQWSSSELEIVNSTLSCSQSGLLTACMIYRPENLTAFRSAVESQAPLVVVNMIINVSLTDAGPWTASALPAQVSTAVLLQGQSDSLSVLDVQNRPFLFNVRQDGLLTLIRVHLINSPLGPPQYVPDCWLLTSPWYLNMPANGTGPFLYYQDTSGDYPRDLLEYYSLYLGMLLSPVPYIRQKATWFSPYIENYTIFASQASLAVRVFITPQVAVVNATIKTGPDALLPLQVPYTGVLDFTNNGAIPLTQVFGVTTANELLDAQANAQASNSLLVDHYVLVLLNNITMSANSTNGGRGVVVNRTVTFARYAYYNTAIDFQGSSNVFMITRGVRLQLRNLILINLPTLPVTQQRFGLFASGMWPFSFDRSAASTLNLVNITMAVSPAELQYMNDAINTGLLNAKVDSQSNTSLQLSVLDGFGYDSSNISLTTDVGPGFNSTPASIPYATFQATYSSPTTSAPPAKSDSSSSSMPAWQIAVVVVGCVVGVSVIVAGLLLLLSRRPAKNQGDAENNGEQQFAGPPTTKDSEKTGSRDWQAGSESNLRSDQLDEGSNPALEIQLTVAALNAKIDDVQLSIHELLGRGAYGEVYRGHWRNLDVAVKIMNINEQDDSVRQCASQEVAVLVNMVHPNVVTTFSYDLQVVPVAPPTAHSARHVSSHSGSNLQPDARQSNESSQAPKRWKLFIIQEFCYGGPLRGAIDGQLFRKADTGEVDIVKVLSSAVDIGRGMQHVHSKNIIHGDLNPNNVLLQVSTKSCYGHVSKVADFGLSVTMDANQTHVSNLHRGTMFYAAPEVVLDGCLTKYADVFAYGVILWELYHGTPPWRKKRMRPLLNPAALFEYDPQCPVEYKELCQRCLSLEKNDRPTFDESLAILTGLQRKLGCETAETSHSSVQMPVPQMTASQQQALRTLAPNMFESSSGNTINIYYNNSTQDFDGHAV